jgi:hypothetical protein
MRRLLSCAFILCLAGLSFADPFTIVNDYNGKFRWVSLDKLSAATIKSLAAAKTAVIQLSFRKDIKLSKDAGGNAWFSFVIADIGSDGKWCQSKGGATLPVAGNIVKAGKYTVKLPLTGIPNSVLKDPKQTISLGPNTSGIVGKTMFSIDSIKGQ